jgi:hypothetical protein
MFAARFAKEVRSAWSPVKNPRLAEIKSGAELFDEGKYFEAHEAWETVWRELDGPERSALQALIQACGAFHLLSLGRADAAGRLAGLALEKRGVGLVDVVGLDEVLRAVVAGEPGALARGRRLRAVVRE